MEKPNGRSQPQIAFGGEHNLTNRPYGTHGWGTELGTGGFASLHLASGNDYTANLWRRAWIP